MYIFEFHHSEVLFKIYFLNRESNNLLISLEVVQMIEKTRIDSDHIGQ
jgi:hypothetical protein